MVRLKIGSSVTRILWIKGDVFKMVRLMMVLMMVLFSVTAHTADDFDTNLKAARQGDVEAMVDVGVAYHDGKGVLKDPFKAKCWIQKAYQNGSKKAERIWESLALWQYSGKCELEFDDETRPIYAKGDRYTDPVTRTVFVWVPENCFIMGCHEKAEDCSKNENPPHRVCLDGFWIGRYEVDQYLWTKVMGANPSRFQGQPDLPVENVSYEDIRVFIRKLNRVSEHRFALPTEAQWEAACRNGGKKINFPWDGDDHRPDANCGNCDNQGYSARTAPVGQFYPNDLGIYDMGGNVKEWCRDFYDKKAYAGHRKKNPVFKEKKAMRVVRGGSFTDNVKKLRCTARDKAIPTMRADNLGFRLVLIRDR